MGCRSGRSSHWHAAPPCPSPWYPPLVPTHRRAPPAISAWDAEPLVEDRSPSGRDQLRGIAVGFLRFGLPRDFGPPLVRVRRLTVVRSPSPVWGPRNSPGSFSLLGECAWGQVPVTPAGRWRPRLQAVRLRGQPRAPPLRRRRAPAGPVAGQW